MMDARYNEPVPERDWPLHWKSYVAHFATGLIASTGMGLMPLCLWLLGAPVLLAAVSLVPFLWLSITVQIRQYVEFLRRNDTPGVDLMDHQTGLVSGLGVLVGIVTYVALLFIAVGL